MEFTRQEYWSGLPVPFSRISSQPRDWTWLPDSSVGKESTCSAGDPSSLPGLGRSAGEGIGYPIQYSWASLVAQLVKNQPAMQETWVQSLGWEDPLENGKATYSSILAWRIPWNVQSMGSQIVGHDWVTFTFTATLQADSLLSEPPGKLPAQGSNLQPLHWKVKSSPLDHQGVSWSRSFSGLP